jgi:hypothetical protein
MFPAPSVPAIGFPSGLFWINSYRDPAAKIGAMNDDPEGSDCLDCGSGSIDESGRRIETDATQHGSL